MYQLRHHDFFKVFLPKNRDPENMDATEMLLEETTLDYGDQIKTNYQIDTAGKTLLDIELLPTHIYMSWFFNKNDPNAQFRDLNKYIDRLFAKKLLQVDPIYRCTMLLDYHLHYYQGDVDLFARHIKYEILPFTSRIIEESKKDNYSKKELPNFEIVSQIVLEWINDKTNKKEKSSFSHKLRHLNWIEILGIIIALVSLIVTVIIG